MIRPFFDTHPDSWALIPCVSITVGRCENPDCNQVHGYVVDLTFLGFTAGIEISF